MPIHRQMHFIWLGRPPSDETLFAMRTWKLLNPTLTVTCWYDSSTFNAEQHATMQAMQAEGIEFRDVQVADALKPMRESFAYRFYLNPTVELDEATREAHPQIIAALKPNFSAASDILRFNLLHHFGGIYADIDIVACKPIPEEVFSSGSLYFRRIQLSTAGGKSSYLNPDLQAWDIDDDRAKLLFSNLQQGLDKKFDDHSLIFRLYVLSGLFSNAFNMGMNMTGPRFFTENVLKTLPYENAADLPKNLLFPASAYVPDLFLHSWLTQSPMSDESVERVIEILRNALRNTATLCQITLKSEKELQSTQVIGKARHFDFFDYYMALRMQHYQAHKTFFDAQDAILLGKFENVIRKNARILGKRSIADAATQSSSPDPILLLDIEDADDDPDLFKDLATHVKHNTSLSHQEILTVESIAYMIRKNDIARAEPALAAACNHYIQNLYNKHLSQFQTDGLNSLLFITLLDLLRFEEQARFPIPSRSPHLQVSSMTRHRFCDSERFKKEDAIEHAEQIIHLNLLKNNPKLCQRVLFGVIRMSFHESSDLEFLAKLEAFSSEDDEEYSHEDYIADECKAYWPYARECARMNLDERKKFIEEKTALCQRVISLYRQIIDREQAPSNTPPEAGASTGPAHKKTKH